MKLIDLSATPRVKVYQDAGIAPILHPLWKHLLSDTA